MALIEWNEELSVGIPRLDNDHQILIKMINELHDAMMKGGGEELLTPIFDRLTDYTETHFTREEQLLKAYGFSGTENHIASHRALREKLDSFKQDYMSGKSSMTQIELSQFLLRWLLEHIKREDMQYKSFLLDKGAF